MTRLEIDALVINRNLRIVTDRLVNGLLESEDFFRVGVVDAGSRLDEISAHTVVRDNSFEVETFGLRINRGYNLAISWWMNQKNRAKYILLLPNDTEIQEQQTKLLIESLEFFRPIGAIIPLPKESPYRAILPRGRVGLGWNFNEGPIILTAEFIEICLRSGKPVFDPDNFRGYLSFVELALQAYANNFGILATDLISFTENESHLILHSDLIKTEDYARNAALILIEGRIWLGKKYGFLDGITLENTTRLVYEEYIRLHPHFSDYIIR
jgi:hypothetical protein